MAFNGSGTFVRTDGIRSGADVCQQQQAAETTISPVLFDADLNEIANAFSDCVTKNGETGALTADLDFGGHRGINVLTPTSRTHVANLASTSRQVMCWGGTFGGSSGNYTCALSPQPGSYDSGMIVRGKINHTQTSTTATIDCNSLGAKNIKVSGLTISPYTLVQNDYVTLVYDGTDFQLISRERSRISFTPSIALSATGTGTVTISNAEGFYKYAEDFKGIELDVFFQALTSSSFSKSFLLTTPVSSSVAAARFETLTGGYVRRDTDSGVPARAIVHAHVANSTQINITVPDQAASDTPFPSSSLIYVTLRGRYSL